MHSKECLLQAEYSIGFLKKVDIKKIRIVQMEINDDHGFCFQLTSVIYQVVSHYWTV